MGRWSLTRVVARDPHESGRTASSLELFFDLVFVVAVSLASQNLHHFESGDHFSTGLIRYLMAFFAIWLAWVNFTWYASEFATDDWLYRVLSLVQMAGALVLAAGIPSMMEERDFAVAITGYVIMRVAMAINWLRVANGSAENRSLGLRYATGIGAVQVFWIAFAFVSDDLKVPLFAMGAVAELLVPAFAEWGRNPQWHPHHIAERYGLFTIIVLGESILASATSIVHAVEKASHYGDLILLAITGFVIVAGMWWVYFGYEQGDAATSQRRAFLWGYGHYFIFAAAAAVSAGIEVAIDYDTHHTGIDATKAALALCVPVAVFVGVTWFLVVRSRAGATVNLAMPIIAVAMVAAAAAPYSLQLVAVLMVALVVALVVLMCRDGAETPSHPLPGRRDSAAYPA